MAVHLTAADLARVMLLLDASTIAKNVGRHLVFAASRHDVCSHSDLAATPMAMRPGSGWVESADDALVVLIKLRWPDASPRCQPADCLSVGARGGVVWARPHDQDQLCRVRTRSLVGVWVGRSRVGVSCTRPAVHGGLATHRVRVPPGQPELPGPGGHRLRPGWGHKARQKMC